ncbi:hypothetical protein [Streptomyces sp. BBFR102]|uniref:hypothetical protein n=1 Tax=Streptomyces sp. BBFR102 TaxID=3448171 RepID=UPI003F534E40
MSAAESPQDQGARTCDGCEEWKLAETVATAQRDLSRATDCRVLLRRHQESAQCRAGEPR